MSIFAFAVLTHDATIVVLGGARDAEMDVGVLGVCSANGILRLSVVTLAGPLHNWHTQRTISNNGNRAQ